MHVVDALILSNLQFYKATDISECSVRSQSQTVLSLRCGVFAVEMNISLLVYVRNGQAYNIIAKVPRLSMIPCQDFQSARILES